MSTTLQPYETTSAAAVSVTDRDAGLPSAACVRHRVVEMTDLSREEIHRWLELRASNPALDSPYFHPGFTASVAATDPRVRVIVGENAQGAISSFLPVQITGRRCRPAGSPAADFQGPICAPGTEVALKAAIRAAGTSSYEFDHMRDGIPELEPSIFQRQQSPYIEVTGGIEAYLSRASRSGRDKVGEARRLGRKAERDHGPIRFVAQSTDAGLLDTVIALKRRQYATTGARDYFADPRHMQLMHRLLDARDTAFGGMLSAIYAGSDLLAAHFGIRSGPILHWWFPVYDPAFSSLSPGWQLLCAVIDAAPELALERIDLGRGMDDYKRRAMTGHQLVCQGAVFRGPLHRRAAVTRRRMLAAIKASSLAPTLRSAIHYTRRRSR